MVSSYPLYVLTLLLTECYSWSGLTRGAQRSSTFRKGLALFQTDKHQDLSGETLGDKYLLCNDSKVSTSGKSSIYKAYQKGEDGKPTGDQVVIKVSDNHEALERERENFEKVDDNQFVKNYEYLRPQETECEKLQKNGALVLERGTQDLKSYLEENGPLRGDELKNVARKCVDCIAGLHNKNMVWTEMKSENFVRQDCGTIKGIDLESAVPHKGNPIDYSPKACPPEFAVRYLCGSEPFMEMEYNFDIWSLGMALYELSTGEHYFENRDNIEVCKELKNTKSIDINDANIEPPLKDLIAQCLALEPTARPAIEQVKQHVYFTQ